MSGRRFTSAFAAELNAYLDFKESMAGVPQMTVRLVTEK